MLIDGIGISGYRSFGNEVQRFGPLSQINLIVGKNNTGKSNLLRFLAEHFSNVTRSLTVDTVNQFNPFDFHQGSTSREIKLELGIDGRFDALQKYLRDVPGFASKWDELRSAGENVLGLDQLRHRTDLIWFPFRVRNNERLVVDPERVSQLAGERPEYESTWQTLWKALVGGRGGSAESSWIPETLAHLAPRAFESLTIRMVPAIREIRAGEETMQSFGGEGLIDKLAKLQDPDIENRHLRGRFDSINEFLRSVLESDNATISIPYSRNMVIVNMDGRELPLSHLGTGIHEVVILAAVATVETESVLCVEEPEIHLHPGLQRKLMAYLRDHTSNQYFIATHSAQVLDLEGASIFRVTMEDGSSQVESVVESAERFDLCRDLGYRASDLVQANCVIWVEGPSDRIYLNHWISAVTDDLVEGLHYSIMFYGGSLLNHVTANDSEVGDFVRLTRLNQNVVVVIDSDRKAEDDEINSHKKRIESECSSRGLVWVTEGRMVENYVEPTIRAEALDDVHPRNRGKWSTGPFDPIGARSDEPAKRVDKVRLAQAVASRPASLDVLDLRARIENLVDVIRTANE